MNANLFQMATNLQNNPAAFLSRVGANVPQNIDLNNPNAIIQHLMSTGQVSQARYDNVMRFVNQYRR